MNHDDCSRREFLKKFAALSTASVLFGINAGCSDPNNTGALYGPPPVALYGPSPVTDPMVLGIYFVDADTTLVSLYGHTSVPINSKFVFKCTTDMSMTVPATVTLSDAGNNPVALNAPVWDDARSLSVTPSANLSNSTDYTLSLTDAKDATGKSIIINSSASANFKTMA